MRTEVGSMTKVLRVRDDVSAVHTEYGVVLLDERAGRYWKLSVTAGVVFDAFRDGGTADDAVEALRSRYPADEQRVLRDVHELLDKLVELGVVHG